MLDILEVFKSTQLSVQFQGIEISGVAFEDLEILLYTDEVGFISCLRLLFNIDVVLKILGVHAILKRF